MGLHALGIGPGDEVILADTNWIATAAPIVHLGAKPIFVDIDPVSWCLNPKSVENKISSNTKAIIAVHLYGNLCEMDELLKLGRTFNIPVIEDSAEALGSIYKGRPAGSMGTFGCFSFHGTKTLTTGEGGMFVTNDDTLFEKVETLSNHGRSKQTEKQFWPDKVGFKFKMSNIQAALGLGQMERIDQLIKRKQEILSYYQTATVEYPEITLNPLHEGYVTGAWMPNVVFSKTSGIKREAAIKAFGDANIDARVFFWPLSSLDFFESVADNYFSWDIPTRAINLPSYHDMTDMEQDRVIEVLLTLIGRTP